MMGTMFGEADEAIENAGIEGKQGRERCEAIVSVFDSLGVDAEIREKRVATPVVETVEETTREVSVTIDAETGEEYLEVVENTVEKDVIGEEITREGWYVEAWGDDVLIEYVLGRVEE